MENKPEYIICHHTGDHFGGNQFEKVNLYHKSKDFPLSSYGFYVGYHYFIEKGGHTICARKENEIGAHTIGYNTRSIAICLAGNFDEEEPTAVQKAALGQLLKDIMQRRNISILQILNHRDVSKTSCPGSRLEPKWAAYAYLQFEVNLLTKLVSWLTLKLRGASA